MPRSYKRSFDETPEAIDPIDIPVLGTYRLPVVQMYDRILLSGEAAVHPKQFATRGDAQTVAHQLIATMKYYRETYTDAIFSQPAYRTWESKETGRIRLAFLPDAYRHHNGMHQTFTKRKTAR